MAQREYHRVRTVPPTFWSPELRQAFDLWLKDMKCGMRPYTDRTVQTFECRFILYTRMGWEDKTEVLTLNPRLISQMQLFPTSHDDGPDALHGAVEQLRKGIHRFMAS